ncbi:unnamed protein product, partial [Mesorhabditis spiculigera]
MPILAYFLVFLLVFIELTRAWGTYNRKYEFRRDPLVESVDCKRIIAEDCDYRTPVQRIVKNADSSRKMDCESIRERVMRYSEYPLVKNSIAVARVVNEDYDFHEEQLGFTYHPDHVFCFAVDLKAEGTEFHRNLLKLESCVENVHLTKTLYNVSGNGAFMSHAFRECWKTVLGAGNWAYVLDLQNYDVIIKTAPEISDVIDILNGSNAIQLSKCERCAGVSEGWYLNGMGFYANQSFPDNSMMQFATGLVQSLISRAAIDFLINTVSLDGYLGQHFEDTYSYGIDERFLATLQQTDVLKLPGGMTSRCLKDGHPTQKIIRYSNWDCSADAHLCASGKSRHCICLLGIEELPTIAGYPFLVANKMMPSFDYAAISCVGELLYNRTYGFAPAGIRADVSANLTSTRFHNFMAQPGAEASNFDCTQRISPKFYRPWATNCITRIQTRARKHCAGVGSRFHI